MSTELPVEMFPIANLKLYDRNSNEGDVGAISESIRLNNWQGTITVNRGGEETRGMVLAGNHRLMAAQQLGISELPVYWTDLPDDKARAYAEADNKASALSSTNDAQLLENLRYLTERDLLPNTLYDSDDFDALLRDLNADPSKDPDAISSIPKTTTTKLGDLFQLGEHRVLCGDSTNAEDVERLMDGQKADMVFTDPPYGIGYEYASHDDNSNEQNAELVERVFKLLKGVGKVWTCGLNNLERDISRFGKAYVLVWDKKFAAAGSGLGGASTWEPVLVVDPTERNLKNNVIEVMTDREEGLRNKHPCPKPVKLFELLLEAFTKLGATIVDPFLGSGSTLIACEKLNRKCYGMEIDPLYVDVIIKRWEDFTDKKAQKL